jgi:hypothetical protein
VKFFFPDSQDQVDPSYDFVLERGHEFRVRQRDDRYAHEVLAEPPFDGILVSKPIVDGLGGLSGKYTSAQRHRLYRLGVRRFFRLENLPSVATMGDCGAFSYLRESEPPYSVHSLLDFYIGCGFDQGVSLDHVVFGFDPTNRDPSLPEWRRRKDLTLQLASTFIQAAAPHRPQFMPIGAAQGWSPESYADSVHQLQQMGYDYIALGGMVPLKTSQILACLEAIDAVKRPGTRLHLLGISRLDSLQHVRGTVESFDTTSPFRQAFKDDRDNYYTLSRTFVAIRVPQVEANVKLKGLIGAGRVDQARATDLERRCLRALREFDAGRIGSRAVIDALAEYAELFDPSRELSDKYAELLDVAPWRRCRCGLCENAGIEIVIFRGTERNKRRGFHNLHVFRERMNRLASAIDEHAVATSSQESQVGHDYTMA